MSSSNIETIRNALAAQAAKLAENVPRHRPHFVRSATLQCQWHAWEVAGPRRLRVTMAEANYPDMGGCIKTAQFLMPDVESIWTENCSSGRDTVYTKGSDGQWRSET